MFRLEDHDNEVFIKLKLPDFMPDFSGPWMIIY